MQRFLRRHFWLTLCGVLFLGIIGVAGGWLPVDRMARGLVSPFGKILGSWGQGLGNKLEELGHLGSLNDDNQRLSRELTELQSRLSELSELEAENQELRALANFKPPAGWRGVGAEIIAYNTDGIRQLVRINRGESDGLNGGGAVLAGGQLIGVVTSVEKDTAEVMLSSDGDFRALAVSQTHRSTGLVIGAPPTGLSLERVPQDQKLDRGEAVITSGLDGAFPPGLRIGDVSSVSQASASIFQSAQLRPPASLNRLRVVTVLVRQ